MEKAEQFFRKAKKSAWSYEASHVNLGTVFFELNKLQEAHQEFSEALKVNPKSQEALMNRATILIMMERYDEAIEDIKRCRRNFPDCPLPNNVSKIPPSKLHLIEAK